MKVLVACEYSGTVRDAFIAQGHDALSCDYLPTDKKGPHYQGDVMNVINDGWDLMIAHPPCTYLCNSGVSWLYKQEHRWEFMEEGAVFFRELLNVNIHKIVIENPIPHRYALEIIGKKYTQIIHPFQFGHPERKSTCLWLKNVAPLKQTKNVYREMQRLPKNISQRIHYLPPSQNRWKLRSKTFEGIAQAMAEQWGIE